MCVRYTPGIHYLLCLRCVKYSSSTVDWEIFTLKIIHVKIFMVVDFLQFVRPAKFFNSCRLQCGRVPGEFLVFSLLPGIRRARYCWLYIVIDRTFTSGGVDLRSHFFMGHHHAIFFFARLIFMVGLNRKIILIAKFSRTTVDGVWSWLKHVLYSEWLH